MSFLTVLGTIFFSSTMAFAAPRILFAGTDVAELKRAEDTINFTMVATDSGNVLSLAGAVLKDISTGATYGGFTVGDQKGTYVFSINKERILQVRPQNPSADGKENRIFRAYVYNTIGESATVELSVTLQGFANTQEFLKRFTMIFLQN